MKTVMFPIQYINNSLKILWRPTGIPLLLTKFPENSRGIPERESIKKNWRRDFFLYDFLIKSENEKQKREQGEQCQGQYINTAGRQGY